MRARIQLLPVLFAAAVIATDEPSARYQATASDDLAFVEGGVDTLKAHGEEVDWDDRYWNCRRNPTWNTNGATYTECFALTDWQPQSTYLSNTSMIDEYEATIDACLASAMETHPFAFCNEANATFHPDCAMFQVSPEARYSSAAEGELAILGNVLTPPEAFAIDALSGCIKKYLGDRSEFYEERIFENGNHDDYGLYKFGGNYVTYMSGLIQHYLPGVASSIANAFEIAYQNNDWEDMGMPDPAILGFRTAEYLEYQKTGRLGTHIDQESKYSMSIALSDPDDFEGGFFRLESETTLFRVPRLSAVVFFSESAHGVTQVQSGKRNVFVTEMWEREDVPIGLARAEHKTMDEYIADFYNSPEQYEEESVWQALG